MPLISKTKQFKSARPSQSLLRRCFDSLRQVEGEREHQKKERKKNQKASPCKNAGKKKKKHARTQTIDTISLVLALPFPILAKGGEEQSSRSKCGGIDRSEGSITRLVVHSQEELGTTRYIEQKGRMPVPGHPQKGMDGDTKKKNKKMRIFPKKKSNHLAEKHQNSKVTGPVMTSCVGAGSPQKAVEIVRIT